jgi:predicted peptidase
MPKTIKQMFDIGNGNVRAGALVVPDDYLTNPQPMPLIVFSHGMGEAYYLSDTGTLTKIFANGCPLVIAEAGGYNAVKDPISGITFRFAVFGLQGIIPAGQSQGWAPTAEQSAYVVTNTILKTYNIDKNRIYKTGLSAGGQETHYSLSTPGIMELYAAGMPLSAAAGLKPNYAAMAGLGIKVFGYHGDSDKKCDPKNTSVCAAQYNTLNPGYYHLTIIDGNDPLAAVGRGHGGWAEEYSLSNRRTVKDINGKSYLVNHAEWFLLCAKGSTFIPEKVQSPEFTGQSTSSSSQTNTGSMATISAIATPVAGNPKAFVLDGTASTGYTSADWTVIKRPGTNNPVLEGGRLDKIKLTVSELDNGDWTFRLRLYPSGLTKDVTFTVGSLTQPIPDPLPTIKTVAFVMTVNGKTYNVYTDNTWN